MMSEVPSELKYLETHEWGRQEEGDILCVGITDHAQDSLGDVVFVELPEVGAQISAGDEVAVVESVKAASDIYAPVSGEVVAINEKLADEPEMVNESPYGDGWFFKIKMTDSSELAGLLDAAGYQRVAEDD